MMDGSGMPPPEELRSGFDPARTSSTVTSTASPGFAAPVRALVLALAALRRALESDDALRIMLHCYLLQPAFGVAAFEALLRRPLLK